MTRPSPDLSAGANSPTRAVLRQRLIAVREQLPGAARAAASAQIAARLSGWLAAYGGHVQTIAVYSAHRGEVDLSAWACGRRERLALPRVVSRGQPLEFAAWRPGDALQQDRYGIWVPAQGVPVVPDLLLIPCVGFTAQRLRLGYGGGYYDRTLAALAPRPLALGIAFSEQQCSFDAAPHDVALDAIVTQNGVI